MIKLGNFTIMLDENTGKFYLPESQSICNSLDNCFKCIKELILEKKKYIKEDLK